MVPGVVPGQERVRRVVLDTNVLVSALLFGGRLEALVTGCKSGALVPLFSRATFAAVEAARTGRVVADI